MIAIVEPGYNIATIAKMTAKTPKPILAHLVRLAIVFAIIPMPILSNPITSKVIAKMVSKKEAAALGDDTITNTDKPIAIRPAII